MRPSTKSNDLILLALFGAFAFIVGGCSPSTDASDSAPSATPADVDREDLPSELAAPAPAEQAPAQVAESPEPAPEGSQSAPSGADGGGTVHTVVAQGVKFEPMFVYIEAGDTVQWTNMAAHNVETIDAMVPDGQEKVLSDMGSEVAVTFDKEGVVVYKCTPHWSTRMGGMVVVGKPENPAAIVETYLAAIASDPSSLPAKGLLKKLLRDLEERGLL
ncbi:MAG: plastocyanin/azurin family copper-binding protein [Pseudomonadota bacterium]